MTHYHPCPGCGKRIKTQRPLSDSQTKRTRLCLSCRIGQNTLPAPQLGIHTIQYLRWLKEMAAQVREVSR